MTTREEFEEVLHGLLEGRYSEYAVMAAWDAQAAELEQLRAKVEATRAEVEALKGTLHAERIIHSGAVPLTAENAPRARVVESINGEIHKHIGADMWTLGTGSAVSIADLIARGATVLAWVTP